MTLNWQECGVAVLLVLCVIRIVYGIYNFFRRTKNNENPCANCASGCELKRQLDKKQQECKETKSHPKKNCCGQFGDLKISITFATANEEIRFLG